MGFLVNMFSSLRPDVEPATIEKGARDFTYRYMHVRHEYRQHLANRHDLVIACAQHMAFAPFIAEGRISPTELLKAAQTDVAHAKSDAFTAIWRSVYFLFTAAYAMTHNQVPFIRAVQNPYIWKPAFLKIQPHHELIISTIKTTMVAYNEGKRDDVMDLEIASNITAIAEVLSCC